MRIVVGIPGDLHASPDKSSTLAGVSNHIGIIIIVIINNDNQVKPGCAAPPVGDRGHHAQSGKSHIMDVITRVKRMV